MGHDQHRHPILGQLPHHRQHLPDQFRIQCARRLVKVNDLRLRRHAPGDGDTLLLSSAEGDGVGIRLLQHAHPVQHVPGNLLRLGFFHFPPAGQSQRHVLQYGFVQEQVVVLEDEGCLSPDRHDFFLFHAVHVIALPVQRQRPFIRPFQKVNAAQERRFS